MGEKGEIEYQPGEITSSDIEEKINSMGFICTIIQDGKHSGYSEVSFRSFNIPIESYLHFKYRPIYIKHMNVKCLMQLQIFIFMESILIFHYVCKC